MDGQMSLVVLADMSLQLVVLDQNNLIRVGHQQMLHQILLPVVFS